MSEIKVRTVVSVEQELDDMIPRSVVKQREGGGGKRLSYLTAHYVVDRLNKVFGALGWSKEVLEMKEITNTTGKGVFPAYLAKVRLTVTVGLTSVVREAYGYGADKSGVNAHELSSKEAISDALKVAAKDLGMSMGLALYDPSQENVSDDSQDEDPAPAQPTASSPRQATPRPVTAPKEAEADPADSQGIETEDSREKLMETTGAKAMVLRKVKGLSLDEVKKLVADSFGGRARTDLSIAELKELSVKLTALIDSK